jgi:hypothetical protein
MKRTIRPATVLEYRPSGTPSPTDVFCRIELKKGRLSISGVIGPRSNGDAWGSCGQINDTLRKAEGLNFAPGWTAETFARLLEIWDRWHLNDGRPECEHQRALGWREIAREKATLYEWRLKSEISAAQKTVKEKALAALEAGETFTPTAEETHLARLFYGLKTHTAEAPPEYEPKKPLWPGDKGPTEEKTLGWLTEKEHPRGILSKPCPTCGYKYGSAWLREEVPGDVLEFLASLPESDKVPAWV